MSTTEAAHQLLRDTLEVLRASTEVHFLMGAGARVISFDERYRLTGARATLDWDFAVRADSWTRWEEVARRLTTGKRPTFDATASPQRFVHVSTRGALDLVPYGGVESGEGSLVWPDGTRMSVLGFEESEPQRERIDLAPDLVVPVASLPSLALLKLVAYMDRRGAGMRRDVQDFDWFARNYEAAGNQERVFDELAAPLREERLDIQHAGAALLGIDVARAFAECTTAAVAPLLEEARDASSVLVRDVLALATPPDELRRSRAGAEVCARFAAFEHGLGIGRGD